MKRTRGNSLSIVVGAVVGAVFTLLATMMIIGLNTGMAGTVLLVLIVIIAIFLGWLIGLHQRIRKRNYYSYLKGYREGIEKKTVILNYPDRRCSITVSESGNT